MGALTKGHRDRGRFGCRDALPRTAVSIADSQGNPVYGNPVGASPALSHRGAPRFVN